MSVEIIGNAVIHNFKEKLSDLDFVNGDNKSYILGNIDIFLDEDKSRFQKAKIAGEIWKVMVFDALKACSKNTRGFSELCNYIDSYIEYEDYLFAIDREYRDHMIHSIWVMMVGIFLRDKYELFCNFDYSRNFLEIGNDNKLLNKLVDEIRKYEMPLWCLVALTHDLGYPIEKTKLANLKMADMINKFGFLKQTAFDYNFTVVHQGIIESLLRILTSVIFCDKRKGKNLYRVVNVLGRDIEYAKSFENLDHGIMSAYLLQKYLDWICEEAICIVGAEDLGFIDEKEVARTVVIWSLFKSIAAHTSRYSYSHRIEDMTCLLIICDELEEFSRYSREAEATEWKEIGVRTSLECNSELLEMDYMFDKDIKDEDVEDFFKKKVKTIYNHFEVDEEGIKKLRIVCKDITKTNEITFIFEKEFPTGEIKIWRTIGGKREEMRDFVRELVGFGSCSAFN